MARLITSGAEFGAKEPDGIISLGSWTISTSKPRSGTFGFTITNVANTIDYSMAGVLAVTYFARAYFWFTGLPSADTTIMFYSGGVSNHARLLLTTTGTLRLIDASAITIGSDSPPIATGQWIKIELAEKIVNTGGATDYAEARLNGVSFASSTTQNFGTTPPTQFSINGLATGGQVWTDDIGVNDDSGANQNSWPPSSKLVLSKSLSDNAKGTGWTDDQAATTNLFNDVDNTPPIGIADTTTGGGGHQLRNATSNANVNYDANMQSYSTLGINNADTINLVIPVIVTGAPVTTSAKAGTVGVVSNPTIANVALGAGGTAGAFWSGVAAGSYPTGWKTSFGTITYVPAVTKATQPVMRVTQVTASTRIAMVCAMGIYIDYTPAVGSLVAAVPGSAHARFRRAAQSFDRW